MTRFGSNATRRPASVVKQNVYKKRGASLICDNQERHPCIIFKRYLCFTIGIHTDMSLYHYSITAKSMEPIESIWKREGPLNKTWKVTERILCLSFKEDRSDFSLQVQPVSNSLRLHVGARRDLTCASLPHGEPQCGVMLN